MEIYFHEHLGKPEERITRDRAFGLMEADRTSSPSGFATGKPSVSERMSRRAEQDELKVTSRGGPIAVNSAQLLSSQHRQSLIFRVII